MPGNIYCLGEGWLELEGSGPLAFADSFRPRVGGTAARLALACAGRGGSAVLLTQLGEDAFGHRVTDTLAAAGVDTSRVRFTSRAPTPLVFGGAGETLVCRTASAELLYEPGQLGSDWAKDAGALAFSSACLVDSPSRYTHLAALDTARFSGVPACFVPTLCPALWPSARAMRETVLQFLPLADIVVLTVNEMEQLLDTREYRVGLFSLLRGHTRLVALAAEDGVRLFSRAAHLFRPETEPDPVELAAGVLCRMQTQSTGLEKLGEKDLINLSVKA